MGQIPGRGVRLHILGFLVYLIEQKSSSSHHGDKPPTGLYSHQGHTPTPPPTSFSPSSVLKAHSIRSLFYIMTAIPCFLRAPNYTGGLCLITSGFTYAVAAIFASRKKSKGKNSAKT
ncbi:hypothetical protein BGX33_002171 [Mortierella sp. NVP41]|nr:hypothetical protein BGX33_002171 [Mortierella sp. NVP41]